MLNNPTISHTAEILHPTQVVVDLTRLTTNDQALQRHVSPAAVMPILKTNAYSHGLVEGRWAANERQTLLCYNEQRLVGLLLSL